MVAPWLRDPITSFVQFNDRLASICVRVTGGLLCLVTAYAPPNTPTHTFLERQTFFHDAQDFILSQRTHGPTLILGDFNARLHYTLPG